jgi:Tol biopolymer transport system component
MPRPLALLFGVFVLVLGAGGGVLALAAGSEGMGAGEPQTALVSRQGGDGPGGDANSSEPAISGNGRFVAFVSRAHGLAPGVRGGSRQVYVRDMTTKKTVLASRANGADGAPGTGISFEPSISDDGRYVVFASTAKNLGGGVVAYENVYLRDLAANTTTLVSRASAPGNAAADKESGEPAISADGRHVAFESAATNLTGEDVDQPGETSDVFVRDLDTGLTELVSRASGATGVAGDKLSLLPSLSADGRYVAFESAAQLVPDDVDTGGEGFDIFVRDRAAQTTELVDRKTGAAGTPGDAESGEPAISADGRHVVFESDAKLTGQRGYDTHIFVRDLDTQTTKEVTIGQTDSGYSQFNRTSISADGRYVAWESGARGLTAVDPRNRIDVFARDMVKGVTVDLARASGTLGLPADAPSGEPSISADGGYVAFASRGSNLSGADSGEDISDVFRRRPVYAVEKPLPKCHGRPATLIGTPGPDVIKGTKRADVILALGGDDKIKTFNGADTICAGPGKDTVDAGSNGEGGGSDHVYGGPGDDHLKLGPELGTLKGEGGDDVLIGSKGGDSIYGGPGNDLILGLSNPSYNADFLSGGPGNDRIYGGPGSNQIQGGPGNDVVKGDNR